MGTLEPILKQHAFFKDLPQAYFDFILGCTSNVVFKSGEIILKEGEAADKFYLIRTGKVGIYISQPREITIQTIQEGDILGWSWLTPPYHYRFSAKAIEDVRALALDGKCLREKCEKNSDLGYELLKRLVSVFTERLEATRLQLLNIYSIDAENK
jgi:CRP/FNR family cyclic AMP-dependent transcriptional regulator